MHDKIYCSIVGVSVELSESIGVIIGLGLVKSMK
jgi:hypothetical protein